MEDTQAKEKIEIIKLKIESKALKLQSYFYVLKTIGIIVGSILLFFIIQKPESILNRKLSQETISRERAKLVLDLIKEEDPRKLSLGLSIIESSYPETDDKWFKKIKETFEKESNIKVVNDLLKRLEILTMEKKELENNLAKEIEGLTSGSKGLGPIAILKKKQIEAKTFEINEVTEMLKINGIVTEK
jgi:RNase H-fold protein (predicted Holliday junction resolvase)